MIRFYEARVKLAGRGEDFMFNGELAGQFPSVGEAIEAMPVMDVHTHLVGGRLGARGLHDIILYHMAVSDLYAAGCPSGARLSEFPKWPSDEEARFRLEEAIPYLSAARNTGISWGARMILADLYDWHEPITLDNYKRLDSVIRERADDRSWQREILRRTRIERFSTELARSEGGADGDLLQYSLEWLFFARCQWGEFDTALYELERSWGKQPQSPMPIGGGNRPETEKSVKALADVHDAIDWCVKTVPVEMLTSTATHISTDIDLRPVTDAQMVEAMCNRAKAGPYERDIYASYTTEAFLTGLEQRGFNGLFQFSYAAEPLPFETASRVTMRSIDQVGQMMARHPKLRFQCMLGSRHANQSMCTLCRELPNFSLMGYWWHNFFPATIRAIIDERLDMLPVNKQVGFFSDAYVIEWAYGKLKMVKRILAEALEAKVQSGQYTAGEVVSIARDILYNTPRALNSMEKPHKWNTPDPHPGS